MSETVAFYKRQQPGKTSDMLRNHFADLGNMVGLSRDQAALDRPRSSDTKTDTNLRAAIGCDGAVIKRDLTAGFGENGGES